MEKYARKMYRNWQHNRFSTGENFSEKMQNKFRKKSAFPEKGVKSADTQPLCAVGCGCSLSGFVIE